MLRELAGPAGETHFIDLGQNLSLLPMTEALFDALTGAGTPRLDGFLKARAGFDSLLAACSANGPVAYVEAELFGGLGTQSAQVWQGGEVVFGPLHQDEDDPAPEAGSPISQALRQLGVVKGDHDFDEFDAVGLGRHRETDDWLPRVS